MSLDLKKNIADTVVSLQLPSLNFIFTTINKIIFYFGFFQKESNVNEEYYHDTHHVARMPNIVSPLKQVMEGHILLTYFFSKLFPFSDSLEFLKKRKKKCLN